MIVLAALVTTCNTLDEKEVLPTEMVSTIKKNPFSVENVTQAFDKLVAKSNGRIKVEAPSTTHNYVRFEPQNLDQVMLLQDLGYDLWDEPLDQHIEYQGDYYQQPGIPDSLNYFYTLIPANYTIVQSVPHTIISQVVLFNEDSGDEQDPEDHWIPDPDPGGPYCYDEWGQPYVCDTDPRVYLRSKNNKLPEDLVKKTTKYLLEGGVDLVELYNTMMKQAGYDDELITEPSGRVKHHRYYPAGRIMVRDNSINQNVPVVGTYIKSRRFFKLGNTYSTSTGHFYIDRGYRNKAQVIVKFKNGWAKVRGVNAGLKIWQWTHPVKVKLGMFEGNAMENIQHTFQYSSNADTHQAMVFTAAHTMNSIYDLNQYCASNSITSIPSDLNLWVTTSNWFKSSTAPMLAKVLDNTKKTFFLQTYLPPPSQLGAKVLAVMMHYAPDVAITINNDSQNGPARTAHDVVGQAFHELSHAVHYNKVGRNYWLDVITTYISNYTSTGTGYGNKNNLTAVVESWGFFIGPTFTRTKYTSSNINIANDQRDFLEFQRRDDNVSAAGFSPIAGYSRGWIPWGMLHDLIDVGEPGITLINDQVSGYSLNGIFKGYTSSATTVQILRQNILSNNGNMQSTQVNSLVTSYGW